jgi:formate hydrogenlyase transcriptional activator
MMSAMASPGHEFEPNQFVGTQLRKTLNTIPAYTWYAVPSGTLTFVNEAYADYLGLAKDDPLRLGLETGVAWDTHIELVHPDDREETLRVGATCNRTGAAGQAAFRIRNSEGEYRWFLSRLEPLRASDGTLLYWIGINLDIEELKRAEEQRRIAEEKIREQEMELRHILDLTPQQVAVYGPGGERLYVNRVALDYIGVSLEEWLQTPGSALRPVRFIHPDDRERAVRAFSDVSRSGGSAYELELRVQAADGSYRWFLVRYNPVRDEHGQIMRWYVASTDIDERKSAEERLQQENVALREEINQAPMFEEIVGSSEPLKKVLAQVSKVAPSDSTVLVLGETGTGKELIARAIHKRSKRAARAFIAVNCGAIPASLIASELFGHEKGAFTGATQRRIGRFEAASGGTIFLDEVGDLPPDVQIALLRVLQEREIERVGNDKPIPVDVRVMAATHRDLEKLVSEDKFRQDLLYRLNVVPLKMPSLRERAADIPLLVEYFIARFGKKVGKNFKSIEKKTLKLLQAYGWPGNIRELQNVIERAVILSDSNIFAVDEAWLKREPSEVPHQSAALNGTLLVHEKEAIEAALAQSHGRVSGPAGAAAKLGVPDSTLDAKIKRLGIDKYRFKSQIA